MRIVRALSSWLVLVSLAACGGGDAKSTGDSHTSVTIRASDGAKLEIPAGALPAGVSADDLAIRALEVPAGPGEPAFAFAYELQPEGLRFEKPLVLTRETPFASGQPFSILLQSGDEVESLEARHALSGGELTLEIPIPHFSTLTGPLAGPIRALEFVQPPPTVVPVGQTVTLMVRLVPRLRGETPLWGLPGHFVTWDSPELNYDTVVAVDGPISSPHISKNEQISGATTLTFSLTCSAAGAFTWTVNANGRITLGYAQLRDATGAVVDPVTFHKGQASLSFSGTCVKPSACCGGDGTCSEVSLAAECDGIFHEGQTCEEVDCSTCETRPNAACKSDGDCRDGACDPSTCTCDDEDPKESEEPVCEPEDPTLGNYIGLGGLLRLQEQLICQALTFVKIIELISSALGVPPRAVAENWTTFMAIAAFQFQYLLGDVNPLFNNSEFECGEGPNGFTLCSAMNNGSVPAGDFHGFAAVLKGDLPTADPVNHYQYAFVLDADGDTSNNYQPSIQYPNDFFKDTDRWYEATYTPSTGFRLEVKDARDGSITTVASDARMIFRGNVIFLLVPSSELAIERPKFRATAFRHTGDYGLNPPYDYDGSVHPAVAEGLADFP